MKYQQIIEYLIIAIITFLVAYILGLVIVGTVDQRLSEISINMPEIKLPEGTITAEKLPDDGPNYYKILPKIKKIQIPLDQDGGADVSSGNRSCSIPETRTFDEDMFKTISTKMDKIKATRKPDLPPARHGSPAAKGSIPSSYPSDLGCDHGITETDLKNQKAQKPQNSLNMVTYYKNPKDMTRTQQIKFKNYGKIKNMTVQDYENWLLLYRDDPENLQRAHRDRLRWLLRGQKLTASDIPEGVNQFIPPTAETRYNRKFQGTVKGSMFDNAGMLNEGDQMIHAANHMDYDHYIPPKHLKHLSTFNPDETRKHSNEFLDAIRPQIANKLDETPVIDEIDDIEQNQ